MWSQTAQTAWLHVRQSTHAAGGKLAQTLVENIRVLNLLVEHERRFASQASTTTSAITSESSAESCTADPTPTPPSKAWTSSRCTWPSAPTLGRISRNPSNTCTTASLIDWCRLVSTGYCSFCLFRLGFIISSGGIRHDCGLTVSRDASRPDGRRHPLP